MSVYDKYEKTGTTVVVCAGMLVDYWRRGDFSPDPSLLAMLEELAADVDAHRAATAAMNEEVKRRIAQWRSAA